MQEIDYRVDLDIYSGPLDLLLYLIKKAEVEITDIPLAIIADQYLEFVQMMRAFNVDTAAEFLVMAATLLEIKSRTLLPREEVNLDEIEDPRFELVTQLMEYKKFKHLGVELRARAAERERKFARPAAERTAQEDHAAAKPLEEVDLWDLVNAFSKLMKETLGAKEHTVVYDDVSVRECMDEMLARLRAAVVMEFRDIFAGIDNRVRIAAFFLALLELIRLKKVRAEQSAQFGGIQIALREDARC